MDTQSCMKLLFLSLITLCLWGSSPKAFSHLGEAIDNENTVLLVLLKEKKFKLHQDEVLQYLKKVEESFALGYALDVQISSDEGENEKSLQLAYLHSLRSLEKDREDVQKLYYKEVSTSIQDKDNLYFLFLIDKGKYFLDKNPKLKKEVLSYSKEFTQLQKNSIIKELQEDKALDDRSYAFMQKMQDEYKAYQAVLAKAQALKLRQLLVSKKKGGVIVYASEKEGNIEFYIENLFHMHVSTTLFIENIQGYETKASLPYKLVLEPKQKVKAFTLHNTSYKKQAGHFSSHISWAKGSIEAKPDKDFIYALPFHHEQRVSQGFNGKTSHKGNARYAVDFAMDIGTPIYASRGGKVVEMVQRHNKHGMSLQMRQYANYIIIEHEDKTLGRYFHLKQNSVKVKLGEKVKKGELIALSGNTGRTSGPHLHFVVTKAEEVFDNYKSMSVPIKFLCSDGVLDKPLKGKFYCP